MPLIRAWRRLGLAGQLGVFLSVSLVVIGALVISWFAYARANATASCVNGVLGARNGTGVRQLVATDRFAGNLADYLDHALKLKGQSARLQAFQQIARHTDEWHTAVHAARVAAEQHPLGLC